MKKKEYKNEAYEIICETTDYLNYVTKSSTRRQREKLNIGDVFINALVCKKCGDYIRSMNRHDFKWCKCKSVAVDGGSCYQRALGNEEDYISILENFWDVDNEK